MSDPIPVVRAVTYERDLHRCCSCGTVTRLQYQHRRVVGMGGSKERPSFQDGVTSCALCNPAYESTMQRQALRFGWKVRSWVQRPELVPVWFVLDRSWFTLTTDGRRVPVTRVRAMEMMHDVYGDAYDEEKGLIA